nr:hypothetical protein [Capillimicrobium parvum]
MSAYSASIAGATSPAGGVGDHRRGLFEHEQLRVGDLAGERFGVADGKERVAATVHHQWRTSSMRWIVMSAS